MKTLRFCRHAIRRRISEMCVYHPGTGIVVDNVEVDDKSSLELLYECLINITIAYIQEGRRRKEGAMSRLEMTYVLTPEFYACEDPRKYIEEHRETNDHSLIMHCLENYHQMEYSKYRLQILSILLAVNNFRNVF